MIYKFRFDIYNDHNDKLVGSISEESGNFWWAFLHYMQKVMNYARVNDIGR